MAVDTVGQPTLEHGDPRLHLPALTVLAIVFVQTLLHLATVSPRRRLVGRSPDLRRQRRTYALGLPSIGGLWSGVEAGVGQRRVAVHLLYRGIQERHEAIHIDARPAARADSEEQMAGAIDRQFQLGEAAVNHGLPTLLGTAPAA